MKKAKFARNGRGVHRSAALVRVKGGPAARAAFDFFAFSFWQRAGKKCEESTAVTRSVEGVFSGAGYYSFGKLGGLFLKPRETKLENWPIWQYNLPTS